MLVASMCSKSLKKIKLNLADMAKMDSLLFLLGYELMLVPLFISTTMLSTLVPPHILALLRYAGILLILLDVAVYKRFSAKALYVYMVTGAIFFVSYRIAHSPNIFFAFVVILGCYRVDYRKMLKLYLVTVTVLLTVTVVSSLVGLIDNIEFTRDGSVRMALGMVYPTDLGARMFYLVVAFFLYRWENFGLKDIIGYILAACFVWKIADARLDTILILLLAFIVSLAMIFEHFQKYQIIKIVENGLMSIGVWMPLLFFSFINLISYFYRSPNTFYDLGNRLLSGRLGLGHAAFQYYPVKIWGQEIVQQGWGGIAGSQANLVNYFMIDSAFVRLLLMYGLIVTIVVLVCWTVGMVRLKQYRMFAVSMLMIVIAISGMIDQHMFEVAYNPVFFLFTFESYFKRNRELKG